MSQQPNPARIRGLMIAALVFAPILLLWGSLTVTIPSGHAGLVFYTFGEGIDPDEAPLTSGFHFKAPWNKVYDYEVRQKERMERIEVLSSNLLKIEMDMTIFFQPQFSNLGLLEIERGRNYEEKVVVPAMRSVAREVIAKYLPEEFNTTRRDEIQTEIDARMTEKLSENYLQLNDVLIRNIRLPKKLEEAIERKLQQEQESLEYEFRLEKASKEADRMRIEAEGIRDYQAIVSKGISQELLKWKGIEATSALANSPNTKVVVIGSAKDGLPLILGDN
ncbi:MAG: prohibitin family protein [Flavobacteriales bacterium]|jgi:regulator of protease activity HflC (stomatin/prohibitin superfamily)|nr:prohibitin family protein [Flavobacteriales bacterium]